MIYDLTGKTASSTYGRLVQVIHGVTDEYYDGFGNTLSIAIPGPTGATGPQGTSFNWMGQWDAAMNYFYYDFVSYGGSTYIYTSLTSGTTSAPGIDPNWQLSAQGATGPQGATGSFEFYFQTTPPVPDPINLGARWIDSDNGIEYVWVNDGLSNLWMQPTQGVKMSYNTTSIGSASQSLTFFYEYYGVTYSEGICYLTLPLGTSPNDDGKFFNIADEVGGISNYNRGISVTGQGGQLINGETDIMMKLNRMSLAFIFRNSNWKTI